MAFSQNAMLVAEQRVVSFRAVAAVLACEDLSTSERLTALALASYANTDGLAWPRARVAAARAGLGVGAFAAAWDALAARGLIALHEPPAGAPRADLVELRFARSGPWWDGPVNAPLLEAVLARTASRGAARLLLAVIAALADRSGVLEGCTVEELLALTGLSDTTFRRARTALLSTGELERVGLGGGRGRTRADSIRERGILQPPVVRPATAGGFELIAGERRWRAAKLAGMIQIEVLVKQSDDPDAVTDALAENMVRDASRPSSWHGHTRR